MNMFYRVFGCATTYGAVSGFYIGFVQSLVHLKYGSNNDNFLENTEIFWKPILYAGNGALIGLTFPVSVPYLYYKK
jgi:hypothetical protein